MSAIIPKGWPKRAAYSKTPIAPEMNLAILRDFLSTGKPEDLHKTSSLIEAQAVHPHIYIKKLPASHPLGRQKTLKGHANYGIFAAEAISAGAVIGEYVGEMYLYLNTPDASVQSVFAGLPFSEYRWMVQAHHLFVAIDGQNIANEMALINDYRGLAKKPNAAMQAIIHKGRCHFGYVACWDIKKGEELLTDYGEMFWETFARQKSDH